MDCNTHNDRLWAQPQINTEVIQKLTLNEVEEYSIVPFKVECNTLFCFGDNTINYAAVIEEISVIIGTRVIIEPIAEDELKKLIARYYRGASNAKIKEISYGQSFLNTIIEEAYDNSASDIHIEYYEEQCRIRMRIDGKLIERYIIPKESYATIINQVKILAGLDIAEKRLPQDGRISYNSNNKKFDLRISTLPIRNSEKIVLRLLTRRADLLELENLGFNSKQRTDYIKAIERSNGMILICGPTGSGKSTTLYATLRKLNNVSSNITSLEDPIEYTLDGINQVQLKEEIGLTFSNTLRTILRQDPDIIMLGEIRDSETAQIAIRSSLTGHLIMSTLHTNSGWGAISRLIDMGLDPYLIAESLILCVAQRLLRLLCPDCKTQNGNYYCAVGCKQCYYTGYKGRKAIYEVIPIDQELAIAIRNSELSIERHKNRLKFSSLQEAGLELVNRGITSYEEYISVLNF